MKARDLIKLLQELVTKHGNQEVYSGGEDYPGPVKNTVVVKEGDGYTPTNAFVIRGGL